MPSKIFVNMPVKTLDRSVKFFESLGYSFNKQFTDETATCMVISEDIYVMLLTEPKFRQFSPGPICDARRENEMAICLSLDSRAEVDAMVAKAVAAGANVYSEPQDYGFMYGHSFQDLDGHVWDFVWMDPQAVPQG